MTKKLLIFIFCLMLATAYGKEAEKTTDKNEKKDDKPPKQGNFSLRTSQQPSPFISFGQNIIEKDQVQFFLFADWLKGQRSYKTDIIPSVLYGITDEFSVYFNFPFSPGNKQDCHFSSGLEDFYIQLEYAFLVATDKCSSRQATVVGNITLPTGSSHKVPPTGFGSPSFFLGATYNYTNIQWLYFGSAGVVLTTPCHSTKFGNQYFYQGGIGRNFWTPPGWIFDWLIEIDGQYSEKNKLDGHVDPNSGGNIVYATPSIWISNDKLIIQFGIGFPVTQHFFGKQPRQYYALDFSFGWTF